MHNYKPTHCSLKTNQKRSFSSQNTLRTILDNAPQNCGCYLWYQDETVLYIGKAKNLRARIKSYLNDKNIKTQVLLKHTNNIDWIITANEEEALLLEADLVKAHQPIYNARLKDDKKYPYLCLSTNQNYPQLLLTRQSKNHNQHYFGPYTDVRAARNILAFIDKTFLLRKKRQTLPLKKIRPPCLNFHIQRCLAPCQNHISTEQYQKIVDQVILFLEGKHDALMQKLEKDMLRASKGQRYEEAAQWRNILRTISKFQQRHAPICEQEDSDLIALARKIPNKKQPPNTILEENYAQIVILRLRKQTIFQKLAFLVIGVEYQSDSEILYSFIRDHYLHFSIPQRIIIPPQSIDSEQIQLLVRSLGKRWQKQLQIECCQSNMHNILRLAEKNARLLYNEYRFSLKNSQRRQLALEAIRKLFALPELPSMMECYDISHTSGQETSASSVQFLDGIPRKDLYRRYKILSNPNYKTNDVRAIYEVISRRLRRLKLEQQSLPDLLLIDGGLPQLNAALQAARDQKLYPSKLCIVSLAKKNEELYYRGKKINIDKNNPALLLLRQMRDEAHRFALRYHQLRRSKQQIPTINHTTTQS